MNRDEARHGLSFLKRIFGDDAPSRKLRQIAGVFISHSSHDKYFLPLLERAFANVGVEVWIDQAYLKGGQRFAAEIEAAISRSDALVVLISASAALSEWVRREVEYAARTGKDVIPCRIDHSTLPDFLADLHCLDLSRDIMRGLVDLMDSLKLPPPPKSVVGDCYKEIFRRLMATKLKGTDRYETRIPGMELRITEEKIIRWKDRALSSTAGIMAPSRDVLRASYGYWLEDLFRNYLKEIGWSYSPLDSDHYGEVHYRTRTICRLERQTIIYVFSAKQDTSSSSGDWTSELWLVDADHRFFFGQILDWTHGLIPSDMLVSDDFIVSIPTTPRIIEIGGVRHAVSLSFYCDIGAEHGGIVWFEQLLSMFTNYLESAGYEVRSIGNSPPLFEVHTRHTIKQPKHEVYLFEARLSNSQSIEFLYESECTGSRSSGYSKISFLSGAKSAQHSATPGRKRGR